MELYRHFPQRLDSVCRDNFAVICKSNLIGETLIKIAYKSVITSSFEQERASYDMI